MSVRCDDAMATGAKGSASLARWRELKAAHPGKAVGVEMGGFIEFFAEDAENVSAALGMLLTFRARHTGAPVPMCGVPRSLFAGAVERLAARGIAVVLVTGDGAHPDLSNCEPPDPATLTADQRKALAVTIGAAKSRERRAAALDARITRLVGPTMSGHVRPSAYDEGDLSALERLADLAELATVPVPSDPFGLTTLEEIGAAIGSAIERHNVHDRAIVRRSRTAEEDRASALAMDEEMARVAALQRRAARLPVRSPTGAIVAAGIIADHLSELAPVVIGERITEEIAELLMRTATIFDALALHLLDSTGVTPADAGVECFLSQLAKRSRVGRTRESDAA